MKWKQFAKLYIALLLLANFHQMSSTPSSKKVNTRTKMDDPTDNYVYACLKYDFQVHEALASTKPPFDNYFNISRAIYPSEDVSSKLVNIWVHFTNSSVNLTELEDIAISPSSFNPSLNSVECVADGGYENHLKNINKAFPQICWLILFSSLIGSNLIRMLVLKYCEVKVVGQNRFCH